MPFDPNDFAVRELRGSDSVLDDIDDLDELERALELEREGKDRKTAIERLEARIDDLDTVALSVEGADEDAEAADEAGPLEELSASPAPDPDADTPVIFDTMGAGGGIAGHDTIHRVDDGEPACGARVGQKGQRAPRSRFPADTEDCRGCWD